MDSYRCDQCGDIMEFDAKTQTLKCPSCGHSITIENKQEKIREHQMSMEARAKIRVEEKATHTMECSGCGARIEVDATSTATECPFCGSKYVLAQKQEETLIPDGVLPFQIDKNQAVQQFQRWLKSRFWAPGELKNLYQKDKIQGIYLPYWTFDSIASTDYQARGGRVHRETVRDSDGKERVRVYTTWTTVRGHVKHAFDDHLIPASNKLDLSILEDMDNFNTKALVSYSPEYFSGYGAECFTITLDSAYAQAHREMADYLERLVEQEVLTSYDRVEAVRIDPEFYQETFKHIMAPVYMTAYKYRDKLYHVLINGQTGFVRGEYPKSVAKIAVCVAVILILVFFIFWNAS